MKRAVLKSILQSPRNIRLAVFFGISLFCLGVFLKLTSEFYEGEADPFDKLILNWVLSIRYNFLNGIAIDLTSLGSPTILTIFSLVGILVLLMVHRRLDAFYLIFSSIGAAFGTAAIKNFITRERPVVIPRLVEVVGFSYPSGHSFAAAAFYFSVGIILLHFLPSTRTRLLSLILISVLIGLIGISRIYLGVHYPSDVISGLLLGTAWALLLAGIFDLLRGRYSRT